nr:hypothetical protein [Tanacetum cinerariifolium]
IQLQWILLGGRRRRDEQVRPSMKSFITKPGLACYHRGDSEIVAAVWKGEYHGLVLVSLINGLKFVLPYFRSLLASLHTLSTIGDHVPIANSYHIYAAKDVQSPCITSLTSIYATATQQSSFAHNKVLHAGEPCTYNQRNIVICDDLKFQRCNFPGCYSYCEECNSSNATRAASRIQYSQNFDEL